MSNAEQPEYFTPEEYLLMEERGLTKSEYIDGWIRAMSASTLRHNRVKLNCLVHLSLKLRDQHCQPIAIVMRRTKSGFLREDLQCINASIDLPTLGISLAMRDIYEGIEFTTECVQEPEPEFETLRNN